jgi:riboflavin kinase/FMN adenylyltransferase
MRAFSSLDQATELAGPLHLAIGMFDGLHRGHQAVLQRCLAGAAAEEGLAGMLTFWPHPSTILRPQAPTLLFQSPVLKRRRAELCGLRFFIEHPFSLEFAAITAEEFPVWLKARLPGLSCVYVGDNWRYGQGGRGDIESLQRDGPPAGFRVEVLQRQTDSGANTISSTAIRNALLAGDLKKAQELMGYAFEVEGEVTPGRQLGRTLGFPTLNLPWEVDLVPKVGVYTVRVGLAGGGDRTWPAVANLGYRPTVEATATSPLLEVYLLATPPKLPGPGDRLSVEFVEFLRGEQKFESKEALAAQIRRDIETARGFFYPTGLWK